MVRIYVLNTVLYFFLTIFVLFSRNYMFLDLIQEQIAEIQALWKKIDDFHF